MKDLKNLKGARMISKEEQQGIKGGLYECNSYTPCPAGYDCFYGVCFLSPPGWETGN